MNQPSLVHLKRLFEKRKPQLKLNKFGEQKNRLRFLNSLHFRQFKMVNEKNKQVIFFIVL